MNMNYRYLVTCYLCCVGLMLAGCSKHGNVAPGDNGLKSDTNVYVAGATIASNGYVEATYWKNGVPTILHPNIAGQLTPSQALAVATQGQDVIFAGYTSGYGTSAATIWKNGIESLLVDFRVESNATGVCIKGNDVYVCGYTTVSSNGYPLQKAMCWKNGVAIDLEYASGSSANAIAIQGNDVYIAGTIATPTGTNAVYWKNSTAVMLATDSIHAERGNCIYIDGSDIYVAGSAAIGPKNMFNPVAATYWKNGKTIIPGDTTDYSSASSITVHNGDVLVLGTLTIGNLDSPIYWKNGIITQSNTGYSIFSAIAFNNDNDAYFLGWSGNFAYYNKNGIKVKLGGYENKGSYAYQMALSSY
ncbi:hypothetical protein [Mucilaginibacter sp. dw_454]|uniref:hypothetical protein n=1 Tax=Mucilaginibacter sp. dw_454 TaxID=2720079 RepID=UPI001BD4E73A|nr:hypothetical protein [Mucilaginibacter sp. dw_454]